MNTVVEFSTSTDRVGTPPPQGKAHRLRAIQELESNLAFAQSRCGELKDQVRLIRSLYQKKQESRGGDSAEWEEEMNSVNSSFSFGMGRRSERGSAVAVATFDDSKQQLKGDDKYLEVMEFDKRINTGPQEVVQLILSGMSRTVSCHTNREGRRIDSFVQTEPEIEVKSKGRRVKQTKNSVKKGTKKKEVEDKSRSAEKQLRLSQFVKKRRNSKKNKRRHSSAEMTPLRKLSEMAVHHCTDVESTLGLAAKFRNFRSPTSVSLSALPVSQASLEGPPLPPPPPPQPALGDSQHQTDNKYKSTAGSTTTTSYQLPTVASLMRQVGRRPRSHNFDVGRRIPFVVGKSVAKSHNLGTKIQETLSLIKRTGSLLNPAIGFTNDERELHNILSTQHASTTTIKTNLALLSGYGPTSGNNIENKDQSLSMAKKSPEDAKLEHQQLKSVLLDLQEEFSQLTKKYDDLKEEQKAKGDDPESKTLLSKLDDELNKKENEITVIMKLYNEVNELKGRLAAFEDPLPRYRSCQFVNGQTSSIPTIRGVHGGNSYESVKKMAQFLRRIDQFQEKLKNYTVVHV